MKRIRAVRAWLHRPRAPAPPTVAAAAALLLAGTTTERGQPRGYGAEQGGGRGQIPIQDSLLHRMITGSRVSRPERGRGS
jgi:hypothetical protein